MKLLYTVKEVFSSSGYLSIDNKKCYNIPIYQRGYKWTSREVRKLLDDIAAFKPIDEKFYCLQNITIVPYEEMYNVVDGQQRLTTLTLLLSYLGETELVKNKVVFPDNSIRTETNRFLNDEVISGNSVILGGWENYLNGKEHYDHQDIYHLFHAYNSIDNWFLETQISKDDFKAKLLNNVKLIVNKIVSKDDEEEIFGNLNSKRIPLDGADLFRAILITRVANEETKKEATIKDIIQLNEKRVKIGWEFDAINNWWNEKDVKDYFINFIAPKNDGLTPDIKLFDIDKHPINLLLSLFAESQGQANLTLEFLETYNNSAIALYKQILKIHCTLQDWYQNREIYHYLGFIFNNTSISFKTIWDKWRKSPGRADFIESLKKDIKSVIYDQGVERDFTDYSIDWYNAENRLLIKVLILLDIINSLDKSQPFMHASYFTKNNNDIEHIFPQNPESVKEKKEFIEFLNHHILDEKFDLTNYEKKIESDSYKEDIEKFINSHIESIKINSIGNLVLLYASLNRSIGRNSYTRKRSRVIKYFNEGQYIQPHTFRVFVRYFANQDYDLAELEHWTNADIESNADAINTKIKDFFKTVSDE